ncbi:MAG: M20/M25/M40 family metallo-hydrolase [Clostridia bacterium]|nr:M20/M25/M40 family metallo-hydrolase [Clostridia bacterium]
MDVQKVLSGAAAACGPSGQEMLVAEYFAEQFRPYVDEVTVDKMFNVIAHKKGAGPKVMLCAHQDEISLMVTRIEDDGSIRMGTVGGVDPRILPASRVWVHGREKLFGTIGALPPHLMSAEDRSRNYAMKELYVDVGLCAEKVRELVQIGDLITFNVPSTSLLNGQFAAKTMDDRSCVVMMLCAAEFLKKLVCDADVYFVATCQEEVGSQGATTAAFNIDPDIAIALDGDFAKQPGCSPDATMPMDAAVVSVGPYLQPKLTKRLQECAKNHGIKLNVMVAPRATWTDADAVGLARAGVPGILLSLPMKYMHTTVETIDVNTLREAARLLAHYVSELDAGWEEDLWI